MDQHRSFEEGQDYIAMLAGALTLLILTMCGSRRDTWLEDTFQFIPVSLLAAQVVYCALQRPSTGHTAAGTSHQTVGAQVKARVPAGDMAR
jgi:hypothetical protein